MQNEAEILEDILKFSAGSYECQKKIIEELKLLNKNVSRLHKSKKERDKNNIVDFIKQ